VIYMSGQRDFMKQLWRDFSGDQDRVVQEYARAELAGRVTRQSNKSSVSATNYAKQLLKDGLLKGWLEPQAGESHQPIIRSTVSPVLASADTAALSQTDKLKWAATMSEELQIPLESPEYLERVASWRSAWRPQRVRILLVAESHVAEQSGDLNVNVALPKELNTTVSLPQGFCRLVYCLGYGENDICHPKAQTNKNGTWQFWDLFGSISAGFDASISPEMPRRNKSDTISRLKWKIKVLNTLADAGVWLEDASIIGLYASGKRPVNGNNYKKLIRESFEHFVWPSFEADQPEQVWVIGLGVGSVLAGLRMISPNRVISQPQDRNVSRRQAGVKRLVDEVTGK
jgi:hypothetical protein